MKRKRQVARVGDDPEVKQAKQALIQLITLLSNSHAQAGE